MSLLQPHLTAPLLALHLPLFAHSSFYIADWSHIHSLDLILPTPAFFLFIVQNCSETTFKHNWWWCFILLCKMEKKKKKDRKELQQRNSTLLHNYICIPIEAILFCRRKSNIELLTNNSLLLKWNWKKE